MTKSKSIKNKLDLLKASWLNLFKRNIIRNHSFLLNSEDYKNKKVFATTVLRESLNKELTGYLYKIDWYNQSILKSTKIPLNSGHPFWSGRGGNRGGRGIEYKNNILYVATAMSILKYTTELQLIGEIKAKELAGLHEICIVEQGIWCTSTIHDLMILLSFDGKVIDSWDGSNSELLQSTYSFTPRHLNYNFDIDPTKVENSLSNIESYVSQERLHINSVSSNKNDEVFIYASKLNSLVKIRPLPEALIIEDTKLLNAGHNCTYNDSTSFIANDTKRQNIVLYNLDGDIIKRINTSINSRQLSTQFTKPGWQRGLSRITDDVFLVGSSPALIFEVNIQTGEIGQLFELDNNVKHCVHGLLVIDENQF